MAVTQGIQALLDRLGGPRALARWGGSSALVPSGWPELGAILPDGGFPRGVVELTARRALGGGTSVALQAIAAGQSCGEHAWCAWLDPEGSLHAPGIVAAGVDLARMLVVRSPRAQLGRIAVKVVGSGAFEVVVVDIDAPGEGSGAPVRGDPVVLVRKLSLAAESSGATVILLTDAARHRAPWPVALRLELSRPDGKSLTVRVAKERRGRAGLARTVPFLPVARLAG